jgi:hypothetical protein
MKIWLGGGAVLLAVATQVLSQRPPTPVSKPFIEELVLANHILANEEVVDGTTWRATP